MHLKLNAGIALLLLANSKFASAFVNGGGRSIRPAHFLQATTESKASSAAAVEEKNEGIAQNGDHSFDDILRSRRTVNSFVPILPKDWEEALENAIQSAIYAPNHKRTEPWGFHLLGPETIRKVCELNASIVTKKKGEKAGQAKLERWLEMPGWLVVTCKTEGGTGDMTDPSGIDREDYAAVCCAVQNLCLSLHNAGMGTKWTTGPVNFDTKFNEIVGLEQDEYVVGTIWFGTAETDPKAPAKKKTIDDVLRKTN
ncbi:unnamed protein product [Pseudo-nitzschia multistriata]|uniref:Nitroreductase domain-containing protein n=1 Tax=Pseudo-nitzschia multistriata TaxID=183589 RepID=A0A448Z038_9STRA|nr:unnamed protein product [Pseudo-nitzschia multistriata]